jgi:hypothetical protein
MKGWNDFIAVLLGALKFIIVYQPPYLNFKLNASAELQTFNPISYLQKGLKRRQMPVTHCSMYGEPLALRTGETEQSLKYNRPRMGVWSYCFLCTLMIDT